MDPGLYPDLVAAGGLHAVLQEVTRSAELSLGQIESSNGTSAAVINAARGRFSIYIGAEERIFIFEAWSRGTQMLSGATSSLATLASLAQAWSSGTRLEDLKKEWPSVCFGAIAEAVERDDAAGAVAIIWQQQLDAPVYEPIKPLLLASFAEPRLRALRPFTSHLVLHFSRCIGYPFSRDLPFVTPLAGGRYSVYETPARMIGEVDNAAQAIDTVVAALPGDLGPAILGTANDL